MNRRYFAIDLFAGCGGLSEGFKQAGFDSIAQVEMDHWACDTLSTRHLYYELKKRRKLNLYDKYIKGEVSYDSILASSSNIRDSIKHRVINATLGKTTIENILEKIEDSRIFHGALGFHVLLGGPPCQPYSLAGRSRDPNRMDKDKRHYLYKYYLDILQALKPDIFVYENVPGLFSARAKGQRIFHKLLEDFSSLTPAYNVMPPLEDVVENPSGYILNSADFGVPQSRKRLIVIGYKKSLTRKNPEIKNIFANMKLYCESHRKKQGFLTTDDAIGDLPQLNHGEGNDRLYSGYDCTSDLKEYQIKMRKDSPGILNHKARRHMDSDLERYRFFIEHHKNGNRAATLEDLKSERPDLTPNHNHLDKFIDRFKVQWWTRPSSTIMAHISKDGHYYIHPDIHQCRSFTVREAARCQSFPDNFFFEGPRTSQFMQVGNAVPPIMAKVIAKHIRKELNKIYA